MASTKELYADDPPFIDVALTLRSCGCGYMIVLAMYLNTLLMIAINFKVAPPSLEEEQRQATFQQVSGKEAKPIPEKKEESKQPFDKYEEAQTQEEQMEVKEAASPALLPLAKTAPPEPSSHKEKQKEKRKKERPKEKEKKDTRDKTLKSAQMSIRLPRAPKGHHEEELEQMEKFLAEDDISAIEK
ncbi:hypothetical protein RB195_016513 [Necator americanus]|uniref:Uncharacterized protein n=1 Tax=Necator americanus TaxID=51031 RepID=A0ABR1C4J3_NECAM